MGTEDFPRALSARETAWLDFLLPAGRPGYASFRSGLEGLAILGEGRWGKGDFVLGREGDEIDLTEGMQPVMVYGEIAARAGESRFTITLSLHQPNEDGMVEFQIGTIDAPELPEEFVEESRWSYSGWLPGEPCPATGGSVREIPLDPAGEILLVISPQKRVLWLYDAVTMVITLVPVTNFYNELMLLKGIRDPKIALDHKRLFSSPEDYSDADLREAFLRYNTTFRKVDRERLHPATVEEPEGGSLGAKIINIFRRKGPNGSA